MLKNVFTAILFLMSANSFAQQDYFVLIQADNNQPFYARLNGKTFSSSDMGHLIIPQLKDTSYTVLIGFPKNIFPEQNFVIPINKKDQSYQLKNLGEKGWALFNTATMELKTPVKIDTVIIKQVPDNPAKKGDDFSRLMAGVVNDTSVMYNSYVEEEPEDEVANSKKIKPVNIKTDTPSASDNKVNANETTAVFQSTAKNEARIAKPGTLSKPISVTKPPLYRMKDTAAVRQRLSFVKMINEQKTDTAIHFVYADILNKDGIDTVDILIPYDNEHLIPLVKKDTIQNHVQQLADKEINTPKIKDTIQTAINNAEKANINTDSIKKDTLRVVAKQTPEVTMNKDCKIFASDYDIDKLRVKMLAIDNDDDKIITTRNAFKLKCFSVKQVKALSEAFKTEEGRYRLFDAVYAHVSDPGNFIQLQQLLSDPYYINRFKAMIR